MSIPDGFVKLRVDAERATDTFSQLARRLHDTCSRHDLDHRNWSDLTERSYCCGSLHRPDDLHRCGCVDEGGDRCCARMTQEDLLCDACRRVCRDVSG